MANTYEDYVPPTSAKHDKEVVEVSQTANRRGRVYKKRKAVEPDTVAV